MKDSKKLTIALFLLLLSLVGWILFGVFILGTNSDLSLAIIIAVAGVIVIVMLIMFLFGIGAIITEGMYKGCRLPLYHTDKYRTV